MKADLKYHANIVNNETQLNWLNIIKSMDVLTILINLKIKLIDLCKFKDEKAYHFQRK